MLSHEWHLDWLEHDSNFLFQTNGRSVYDDMASVHVTYYDRNGNRYEKSKKIDIVLKDRKFYHKIIQYLDRIFGTVKQKH